VKCDIFLDGDHPQVGAQPLDAATRLHDHGYPELGAVREEAVALIRRAELTDDEGAVLRTLVPAAREHPVRTNDLPAFAFYDAPFLNAPDDAWIQGYRVHITVTLDVYNGLVAKGIFQPRAVDHRAHGYYFDLSGAAFAYIERLRRSPSCRSAER
jgi:hypothetical protein